MGRYKLLTWEWNRNATFLMLSVTKNRLLIIITSVQNNLTYLTQGRITARWHGRAHWRHLANTIELVLRSAHPSPQLKWKINRFSYFCTPHSRKSPYYTMGAPFLKNCPFPWGSRPIEFMIPWTYLSPRHKRHLDRLSHFCTVDDRRLSLYFTLGHPFPKLPLPMGGIWTPI